jgi:serine/threonine-protein kinase
MGAGEREAKFGEVACRLGLLDAGAIERALDIQEKMRALGVVPKRIGEILVDLSLLSPEKVDEVLRAQKGRSSSFAIEGFELLEKLGQGTTGAVFKARQLSLDRLVALKILAPSLASNPAYVSRFQREAKIVSQLAHVNVIGGIDVGESGGYRFFVMEFVDGPTLLKLLQRGGALDEARATKITLQIARALDHAHRLSLVHQDVKPDNIIIAEGGVAKLCDLGLAKVRSSEEGEAGDGRTIGTPNYISPEQARGEEDVDIRSDVYSLGASYYHALCGTVPFAGPSPGATLSRHLNERPRPPREVNPAVTEPVSRIVVRMLEKRPSDRHQTPAELIEDLEAILAGRPVPSQNRGHAVRPGVRAASRTAGRSRRDR